MRRVTELDALRGLAALSIVVYHIWFPKLFYGWTRVDLFFVLSGCLVTSVILRKAGARGFWLTFFLRRGLRLWPPYFLALLGLAMVNPLLSMPARLDGLANYLTFTQNIQHYWGGEVPPFSPYFFHTWSLAIEFRFYLVWPLVVVLCGRLGLLWICPAMAVASAFARSAGVSQYILAGRADGFALGALLAVMQVDRGPDDRRGWGWDAGFLALAVAAAGFLIGGMVEGWDDLMEHTEPWPGATILATNLFYFAVVGLILRASGHPALAPLRDRRLIYLGTISYGLYLFHPIVIKAVEIAGRALGRERGPMMEIAMIAASLGAAALSWEFVERPLMRLKDRLRYDAPGASGSGPRARAERLDDDRQAPEPETFGLALLRDHSR